MTATLVDRHLLKAHLLSLVVLMLVSAGVPLGGALVIGITILGIAPVARKVMSLFGISNPSLNLLAAPCGLLVIGGSVTFFAVQVGATFSLAALAAVTVALAILRLRSSRGKQTSPDSSEQLVVFYGLAAICALGLAIKLWYFMTPFVLALITALIVLRTVKKITHQSSSKIWTLLSLIPLVLGATWSYYLALDESSEGLIFRSADQYYRASLGFSTIRFGLADHVGAVGYDLKYHWLSEAMMGMLGLISRQSALDVVLRVSAPLAFLATGFAGYFLSQVIGLTKKQSLFAVGLLILLSNFLYSLGLNILKTTEMGQLWGTSFFLLGFSVVVLHFLNPTARSGILLSWIAILTLMTNSTLGMVLVGTSLLVTVQHVVTGKRRGANVVTAIALFGGLGVLSQTLLKSSDKGDFSPRISLGDPFGYSYLLGYSGNNALVKMAGAAALVTLMWFQGGAFVPRLRTKLSRLQRSTLVPFAYAFLVALGGATLMQIGNYEQYRFLLTILILTPVLAARNLDAKLFRGSRFAWIAPTLVIAIVIGWLSRDYLQKSFGDATFFKPRLIYVFSLVMVPFVIWAGVTLIGRLRGMQVSPVLRTVVLTFAVVASVSHTTRETFAYIDYSSQLVSPSAVNAGRYECLEFVKSESEVDDRIATTMWRWSSEFFSEKWYLASAVSERMTYVDGPLYVQNPRPKWLQERADRTLRFAENPNSADLGELQSWGVAWFVADKKWPTTRDWSTVGSVAMENESCVVVKLRAT